MTDRDLRRDELLPLLEEAFVARTTADWVELLARGGRPVRAGNDVHAALADPQVAAREAIVELEHETLAPVRHAASPLRLSERAESAPPRPGARRAHRRGAGRGLRLRRRPHRAAARLRRARLILPTFYPVGAGDIRPPLRARRGRMAKQLRRGARSARPCRVPRNRCRRRRRTCSSRRRSGIRQQVDERSTQFGDQATALASALRRAGEQLEQDGKRTARAARPAGVSAARACRRVPPRLGRRPDSRPRSRTSRAAGRGSPAGSARSPASWARAS